MGFYQGFWRRGVDWIWWRSCAACGMWDAAPFLRSSELSLSLRVLGKFERGGFGIIEREKDGERYIEGFGECLIALDRTVVRRSWLFVFDLDFCWFLDGLDLDTVDWLVLKSSTCANKNRRRFVFVKFRPFIQIFFHTYPISKLKKILLITTFVRV